MKIDSKSALELYLATRKNESVDFAGKSGYARRIVLTGNEVRVPVKTVLLDAEQKAKLMQGLLYGPFPAPSVKK